MTKASRSGAQSVFYTVLDEPVFAMEGKDSLDLLQRISTNDVQSVSNGSCVTTILTNEKGRVVDILGVCGRRDSSSLLLAGQHKPAVEVQKWIERFIIMEEASISIASDHWVQCRCWSTSKGSQEWQFPEIQLDDGICVAKESYGIGESARVVVARDALSNLERSLQTQGAIRVEHGDHERSRILAGIPAMGAEITETTHPMEVRLVNMISFTKGCYVGQEVVARLDTYKNVQKILTRVSSVGVRPSVPAEVHSGNGLLAGHVTSAVDRGDGTWQGIALLREQDLAAQPSVSMFIGSSEISLLDHKSIHGVYPER